MRYSTQLDAGNVSPLVDRQRAASCRESPKVVMEDAQSTCCSESSSSSDDDAQTTSLSNDPLHRQQDAEDNYALSGIAGHTGQISSTESTGALCLLLAARAGTPSSVRCCERNNKGSGEREHALITMRQRQEVSCLRMLVHHATAAAQPSSPALQATLRAGALTAARRDVPRMAGSALPPPSPPSLPQLRSSRPGSASNFGSSGSFGSGSSFGSGFGSGYKLASSRSSAALDALRADRGGLTTPICEEMSSDRASPAADKAAETAARTQRQHLRSQGAPASMAAGVLAELHLPAPPDTVVQVAEKSWLQGGLAVEPAPLRHTGAEVSQSSEASSFPQQPVLDLQQRRSSAVSVVDHSMRCSEAHGRWQSQEVELMDCSPTADGLPTALMTASEWQQQSSGASVFPTLPPGISAGAVIELSEVPYTLMLEHTVERLRREEDDSLRRAHTLEAQIRGQSLEVESLKSIVRELSSARARAASSNQLLQERHNQLLADYGRQVRVSDIARRVQRDAATALNNAQGTADQAEENCAVVRRVALQLRERARFLARENTSLRSRVVELERLPPFFTVPTFSQNRCIETSY